MSISIGARERRNAPSIEPPSGGAMLLFLLAVCGFAAGYAAAAERLEPGLRWFVLLGATGLAIMCARDTAAIIRAGDPFRGCTGYFTARGILRHDRPCQLHDEQQ